jgi:hypothetical protein
VGEIVLPSYLGYVRDTEENIETSVWKPSVVYEIRIVLLVYGTHAINLPRKEGRY